VTLNDLILPHGAMAVIFVISPNSVALAANYVKVVQYSWGMGYFDYENVAKGISIYGLWRYPRVLIDC